MARADAARRRLIVNADDFGRSHSINKAVIRAHREGVLTAASLMVNEAACDEAVALAKENPQLGVGLHLSLLFGHSALKPQEIPGLVNERCEFSESPVASGMKFFFQRNLRSQIEAEIAAQFERFRATGLKCDHINGHLHLHLHPVVFEILMRRAREWNITHLRLTCDPFWLNARLAGGHWLYRASHAVIYRLLSHRSMRALVRRKIRFTERVFGLLQNARVDEAFVSALLPQLPAGDSELYSHPSLTEFRHEFDALVSPVVKQLVRDHDIELIRYQDL
ncbi:MAG TPA: hopanoid biosynthesis-associated protein HpnK [Candidatus Acidoferrum sp.]|nr:hopanoid biosynthesis-associated protein HpnK [Candidatus Acidoferrum sp.]